MVEFFDLYLLVGFISSLYLSIKFCQINFGGVMNFLMQNPVTSWLGLATLFVANIALWPITAFIYLKYM